MRFMLVSLVVLSFLFAQESAVERVKVRNSDVEMLFKKISLLNLINGLNLTREQMEKVYRLNQQLESEVVKRYFDVLGMFWRVRMVWSRWYKELTAGRMPEELMRQVEQIDKEMQQCGKMVHELVVKMAPELEGLFTDAQKAIINSFDPCVIPPKDLRDPVRAGQTPNQDRIIRAFRFLRRQPRHRLKNIINWATERILRQEDLLARMTEEEKQKERQRLQKLLYKVATMPDVDFELKKAELANELIQNSPFKTLLEKRKKIEKLSREIAKTLSERYFPRFNRLIRFFLNPAVVIPVLRDKMGITDEVERKASDAFKKVRELEEDGKLKEAFEAALSVARMYPCTGGAEKALDTAERIVKKMPDVVSGASPKK